MEYVRKSANVAPHTFSRQILKVVFIGAALAITACTKVPSDSNRSTSFASDFPPSGNIAQTSVELTRARGGQSSFVPLFSGTDALGARLRLIEAAEQTIDAQYFLMKPDHAGALFQKALIEAADRGVRVRLLLDDVFTTTPDRQFAILEQHENIEVRLFNPLSRNSAKPVNFLLDFNRVNRRMHNKSLTADASASIVGGRNIADEYFQIGTDAEFADLDIFALGPIVTDISKSFDTFWNDKRAVSFSAFIEEYPAYFQEVPETTFDERTKRAEDSIYKKAVNSEFLQNVSSGVIAPISGRARIVSDTPSKLGVKPKKSPQLLADEIKQEMRNAKSSVFLITPYFVPRDSDLQMFKEIRASGRRVQILTNSLASTNHSYVHGGYFPVRKELLRAGVELYEVRADAIKANGAPAGESDMGLTMHTKAAIFDNSRVFIGSLNYDPRSIEINTEVGLFLESPELAQGFTTGLAKFIDAYAYTLSLDTKGDILWTTNPPHGREVERSDPGAKFLDRFIARITSFLPVKGQL